MKLGHVLAKQSLSKASPGYFVDRLGLSHFVDIISKKDMCGWLGRSDYCIFLLLAIKFYSSKKKKKMQNYSLKFCIQESYLTSQYSCRVTSFSPHLCRNRKWAQQAQYNRFVREWVKELGQQRFLQQLLGSGCLAEDAKTYRWVKILRPRSEVQAVLVSDD